VEEYVINVIADDAAALTKNYRGRNTIERKYKRPSSLQIFCNILQSASRANTLNQ